MGLFAFLTGLSVFSIFTICRLESDPSASPGQRRWRRPWQPGRQDCLQHRLHPQTLQDPPRDRLVVDQQGEFPIIVAVCVTPGSRPLELLSVDISTLSRIKASNQVVVPRNRYLSDVFTPHSTGCRILLISSPGIDHPLCVNTVKPILPHRWRGASS